MCLELLLVLSMKMGNCKRKIFVEKTRIFFLGLGPALCVSHIVNFYMLQFKNITRIVTSKHLSYQSYRMPVLLISPLYIYLPYSWAKMPQAIFPTLICQLASCQVLPRVTRMMGTQEEGGRDFLIPVCYSDCYHVGSDSLPQQ